MSDSRHPYLKACINGARTPDQHPDLPVTPQQLADAALAAHRAGALAVHLHPKTADGVDSLLPDVVAAAVRAVRHAVPGLPLGVTTGFWALPDAARRVARRRVVGAFRSGRALHAGDDRTAGRRDAETADDLLARINRADSPAPVLLHGLDDSCWPLLRRAGRRGLQTRIGLEDTLLLPDGSTAPRNAELVRAAVEALGAVSR